MRIILKNFQDSAIAHPNTLCKVTVAQWEIMAGSIGEFPEFRNFLFNPRCRLGNITAMTDSANG